MIAYVVVAVALPVSCGTHFWPWRSHAQHNTTQAVCQNGTTQTTSNLSTIGHHIITRSKARALLGWLVGLRCKAYLWMHGAALDHRSGINCLWFVVSNRFSSQSQPTTNSLSRIRLIFDQKCPNQGADSALFGPLKIAEINKRKRTCLGRGWIPPI